MNWHFIFNIFFVSLLLLGCGHSQKKMDPNSAYWVALENPEHRKIVLSQTDLNIQSGAWVDSLEEELRKHWDPKIREGNVQDWIDSKFKEVQDKLAGTEDGTIYGLVFAEKMGKLILQELRKHKKF
jgi:hypothetical protein